MKPQTSSDLVPSYLKELGTRISVVARALGDRKSAALTAGISSDSLQRYIRGEVQPPFEALAKLCLATGYSIDWLATGLGQEKSIDRAVNAKQVNEITKNYSLTASINQSPIGDADSDFALINYYDVEVSAGAGSFVEHENRAGQFAFTRDWLKSKGLIADKCALIKARGDSMEPTIHDGDIMLVDTSIHAILDDSIYVIQLDNRAMVKRIQQNLDGSLVIISDNDLYDKQLITPEQAKDVKIAGRVTWYAHDI